MQTDKYQIRLLRIAEKDFTEIISFIAADNHASEEVIANKH